MASTGLPSSGIGLSPCSCRLRHPAQGQARRKLVMSNRALVLSGHPSSKCDFRSSSIVSGRSSGDSVIEHGAYLADARQPLPRRRWLSSGTNIELQFGQKLSDMSGAAHTAVDRIGAGRPCSEPGGDRHCRLHPVLSQTWRGP